MYSSLIVIYVEIIIIVVVWLLDWTEQTSHQEDNRFAMPVDRIEYLYLCEECDVTRKKQKPTISLIKCNCCWLLAAGYWLGCLPHTIYHFYINKFKTQLLEFISIIFFDKLQQIESYGRNTFVFIPQLSIQIQWLLL